MLEIVFEILLVLMIFLAIIAVEHRNLIGSVLELALLTLVFGTVLFLLKAPDVALAALVVGGIIIGLFIYTIEEVKT
ncbi:MAG: hydrogenase subunit MbhD domain-containing protein [Candidatus Natronoplasma sp.]